MTSIIVADIGGTHARFARATIDGARVHAVEQTMTLSTNAFENFEAALSQYAEASGAALPKDLAIAFAGPVGGEAMRLTNSPWVVRPSAIAERFGLERHLIVNDFGAVANAVAVLPDDGYQHLCGPPGALPGEGVITIVGPGTGLGVAALLRLGDGRYHVLETEGGHIDFAPLDAVEDRILVNLRSTLQRVSVERLLSGSGLATIHAALVSMDERPNPTPERAIWDAAIKGTDPVAMAALDRFCLVLGSVAGDLALAHGAGGVVIAGGLGRRLANHLPGSGFRTRFIAKGRFERRLSELPVKLLTYAEPGLYGAAAAFARHYPE